MSVIVAACAGPRSQSPTPSTAAPAPVQLAPALSIAEVRPVADVPFDPAADDPLLLRPSDLHPDLGIGDRQFREDQAAAIAGDKDAALRVAIMFERGENSVPRDERRMLVWLRRASDLKNGAASYQLYLYFLRRGQDREAVRYERRALEQGYTPPPRLDPRRG
ncbi:MAG TPA: hypothetical protein VED01_13260 [Burkholderiales bacterium]|nr:hypothetical protein [Burkholderiales bacterium]